MNRLWDKLYTFRFKFLHWYALKILKVPFAVDYMDGNKLLAITYSWSLEYAQAVKDNWDANAQIKTLKYQLQQAKTKLEKLENER